MRNNNNKDAICDECGDCQEDVINMFDLCIAGQIHTICDLCNSKILNKTLRAEVYKNGKVKTRKEIRIGHKRKAKGLTNW